MNLRTVLAIFAFGVFLSPAISFCEDGKEQTVDAEQCDKTPENVDVDING